MGKKKDLKKVKRATRKLEKAVKKATVRGIQREFSRTEQTIRSGVGVNAPSFASLPDRPVGEDEGKE